MLAGSGCAGGEDHRHLPRQVGTYIRGLLSLLRQRERTLLNELLAEPCHAAAVFYRSFYLPMAAVLAVKINHPCAFKGVVAIRELDPIPS